MIATSLDSTGFLLRNYSNAIINIQNLTSRGCMVMHGVDATEMANHWFLKGMKFDRIVYNFPLAGFFPNESRYSQLCRNRKLVFLFLSNAKQMIAEKGEIHISHKSNGFFLEWNLDILALLLGLKLIEEVHFNYIDYPGYRTKYGFGGDKNFNCNPSKTYKFGLKNCKKQSLQSSYWIMK
uniref:25S rRNA (uridine-N(3))-methyltransferase BMT5-like domain-containing protein n=1 Tax=Davidia involucrata TaxID=16924 RepID=A0A5B7BCY0_DAVIN